LPETWESQSVASPDAFAAEFDETFKRVLPRYLQPDSHPGISLTAGLDSRVIMACLPSTQPRPICYTFSGEKRDTLDVRLAAKVAAVCGLEHAILRLNADFFSNFAAHADRSVFITDGCIGPLGAH